ncbi:hypothetical protein NL676_004805 [Syzygium grande]|nr:hypothetical protein NL676_004805 [Syzygium grande]
MAHPWLSLIISLVLSTATISGQKLHTPTLSLHRKHVLRDPEHALSASITDGFETFFFNQTLDHFNYRPESNDTTFKQRYLINSSFWASLRILVRPIFVYLGAEQPIDGIQYNRHRYYGESIPLGMIFEEALNDTNVRMYFNSAQALADYATIIMHVKEERNASKSPVIVVGGSYGGMLASWFRLKYPHVALGALASSAPILYFDDITPQNAYYSVVTEDFKEASETCFQTIGDSWSEIDRVAQNPNDLSNLSMIFKTCRPLKSANELKEYLILMYVKAAQYDGPPMYPVKGICNGIDGANTTENGILGKIFAGVVARNVNSTCYVNSPTNGSQANVNPTTDVYETLLGWEWQRCSEMVFPMGITDNPMFQTVPFNLSGFIDNCTRKYGVAPRPHWITTYYGGHDIELVLHRFGSNIIFSNGLRDPYSSAGVLKNISDSILAVYTKEGSHCMDLLPETKTDPDWLVMQRKTEVEIIKGWIAEYSADLLAFPPPLPPPSPPSSSSVFLALASWFRLKYPHVALGALASSAPILYFYDLTRRDPYFSAVAKDFLETSFSCHQTIRRSWEEIDRVASEPRGLTKLSKTFKTCRPLQSSSELKDHLTGVYAGAAQYNDPFKRPVEAICNAIDGASPGNDILWKIFAGLLASDGNLTCYVNPPSPRPSQTDLGWPWQDIKLVLHMFMSNIIFSNGLQDPYSRGGVLKNISDTVVAVYTAKASISGQKLDPPTLSLHSEDVLQDPERAVSASITNDFDTLFFNQTLDHFDYRPESYTIFQQRYLIDSKYWGGANSGAPIFI